MNPKIILLFVCLAASAFARESAPILNPQIDFEGHQKSVNAVGKVREARRITESDFQRMAREPGTVVLDARSAAMFLRLHIKGAINLSFPDFTAETLAKVIPTKTTRVLIYCNNNFSDSPEAFPSKMASIALNLSTFVALNSYGYENVYELGPLLQVATTKLELVGSHALKRSSD